MNKIDINIAHRLAGVVGVARQTLELGGRHKRNNFERWGFCDRGKNSLWHYNIKIALKPNAEWLIRQLFYKIIIL